MKNNYAFIGRMAAMAIFLTLSFGAMAQVLPIGTINGGNGNNNNGPRVFPSPFSNILTIEVPAPGAASVGIQLIHEINGVEFAQQFVVSNSYTIQTGNLSDGLFTLVVNDNFGEPLLVKKVLKIRTSGRL